MQHRLTLDKARLLNKVWFLRTNQHLTYAQIAMRLGRTGTLAQLNSWGQYKLREADNRRDEVREVLGIVTQVSTTDGAVR